MNHETPSLLHRRDLDEEARKERFSDGTLTLQDCLILLFRQLSGRQLRRAK